MPLGTCVHACEVCCVSLGIMKPSRRKCRLGACSNFNFNLSTLRLGFENARDEALLIKKISWCTSSVKILVRYRDWFYRHGTSQWKRGIWLMCYEISESYHCPAAKSEWETKTIKIVLFIYFCKDNVLWCGESITLDYINTYIHKITTLSPPGKRCR